MGRDGTIYKKQSFIKRWRNYNVIQAVRIIRTQCRDKDVNTKGWATNYGLKQIIILSLNKDMNQNIPNGRAPEDQQNLYEKV